ncbi:MAG: trehalose-phosphatase [Nitrospirae bacterium]|nr:trehalose-phosphatase [Nitrospirota bacterium]
MADIDRIVSRIGLARRHGTPLLLCLDYDGTLAELKDRPGDARTPRPVLEALRRLVRFSNVRVFMVSGRTAAQLVRLLPIRGLTHLGAYGAQTKRPGGKATWHPRVRALRPLVRRMHRSLLRDLARFPDLIIEDKWGCVGVQARLLPPAARTEVAQIVRARLRRLDRRRCLVVAENAYGIEVGPRGIDKGWAVSQLLISRNGRWRRPAVVYIGDDTSDEAAFRALRGKAVTVRVGKPLPSAAEYRLANPARVLELLERVCTEAVSEPTEPNLRA